MSTACDAHGQIRDGYFMRTKLIMMDSTPTSPTPATRQVTIPLTDQERQEKYDQIERRKAELSNAWKHPTPAPAPAATVAVGDDEDVYERRDRQLRDAWRRSA